MGYCEGRRCKKRYNGFCIFTTDFIVPCLIPDDVITNACFPLARFLLALLEMGYDKQNDFDWLSRHIRVGYLRSGVV